MRPPGEHPVLVWNIGLAAVAAAHSVDPDRWTAAYGAVTDLLAPRFKRYEPVRHASSMMLGMLSSLERKNCWTICEHRGQETPVHALLDWERDAILKLAEDWGEIDRSHRKLAQQPSLRIQDALAEDHRRAQDDLHGTNRRGGRTTLRRVRRHVAGQVPGDDRHVGTSLDRVRTVPRLRSLSQNRGMLL